MSQSSRVKRRQAWFEAGVGDLATTFGTLTTSAGTPIPPAYACPLCGVTEADGRARMRLFTADMLGALLSVEDVPPRHSGGRPLVLTYASELIRESGTGSGAAQRELAKLEGSGLIVGRRIGHQKHLYQANAASPLFSELRSVVLTTVGLADPLRAALHPLSSVIRAAFVYGSVANATDTSASHIDLMIISDSLTYGDVFGALERVTRTVGRKINPTVYTAAEISKRARTENAFVTRVLEQPKLWVIGSEDNLPRRGRRRSFITDSVRLSGAWFSCCRTLSPLEIVFTQQASTANPNSGNDALLQSWRRS